MAKPSLKIVKYINDPVYGGIPITQVEWELIGLPIFQRLRGLRQLARVNYVFPGAEHSRFVHSLGVLFIMGLMTDHLIKKGDICEDDAVKLRIAALLHDIGHYPLSHLGESVYGYCKDNDDLAPRIIEGLSENKKIPLYEMVSSHSKSAHHELLGKYIVTHHNDIVELLTKYELDPVEIAEIFTGEVGSRNMLYSQLLHSSLDADRLDYLLRDSYQTGVKYGLVDLHYLIRLLMVVEDSSLSQDNNKILVCNKKGQHVVEHFLMSRYFHYSQIIFHKTNGAFEGLVKAMYIKLLMNKGFMYNSLSEIHENINDYSFLNFTDSSLEVAFKDYYEKTNDGEYKSLYRMYLERKRPKVVFEMKDLYDNSPQPAFSVLKWELKRNSDKIANIIGTDAWGYQIVPITVEKIHRHYTLTESIDEHTEDLREAVKLYDTDKKQISYLAADKLSVIGHLSNFKSEFVRVFVFDEKNELNYRRITSEIGNIIQS